MPENVLGTLDVYLHGEHVGVLQKFSTGKNAFEFDEDWLERPDRPVLSIAFEGQRNEKLTKKLFVSSNGLPPYFENLLPEKESRQTLANANGVRVTDSFGLLERTGRNLFGAVEIVGRDFPPVDTRITDVDDPDAVVHVDFSLAGVQRKVLLSRIGERMTMRTDEHILKMPNQEYHSLVRNEFAMMRLAKAAGFETAEVEMVTIHLPRDNPVFADMPEHLDVLAVQRFDRTPDGGKIHAEEVHQMFGTLPPDAKYSMGAGAVGLRLKDSGVDPVEFIRQMAFHAIVGNGDTHAKNFSVVYRNGRDATLSPVYDAVSTTVYKGLDESVALKIGGVALWKDLDVDAFVKMGEQLGVHPEKTREAVVDTIQLTLGAWHEIKQDFPDSLRPELENHFSTKLALTRRYIMANGFPPPLPPIPEHPGETHRVDRTTKLTVVRRIEDGMIDNPMGPAMTTPYGKEMFMLDGRNASRDDVMSRHERRERAPAPTF